MKESEHDVPRSIHVHGAYHEEVHPHITVAFVQCDIDCYHRPRPIITADVLCVSAVLSFEFLPLWRTGSCDGPSVEECKATCLLPADCWTEE